MLGVTVGVITTAGEGEEGLKARRLDTDVEVGVDGLAGTEALDSVGVAAGSLMTIAALETSWAACIRA